MLQAANRCGISRGEPGFAGGTGLRRKRRSGGGVRFLRAAGLGAIRLLDKGSSPISARHHQQAQTPSCQQKLASRIGLLADVSFKSWIPAFAGMAM
jgi:hypothetical protein